MFKNQYQLQVIADSLRLINAESNGVDQKIHERIEKTVELLKRCNKIVTRTSDLLNGNVDDTELTAFDAEVMSLKEFL